MSIAHGGAGAMCWKIIMTPFSPLPSLPVDDREAITHLRATCELVRKEIGKAVIGQEEVVEQLLLALLCGGHALLEGVPGLAKTLLISTLSRVLDLGFKRIQFTPDLMPADITGTELLEIDQATGKRHFRFVHGPLFTNMVLADEINRTPPRTQSALLEAMQERHVTVGEMTWPLPAPFFVLATRNPIEQEGTFPLPEAQLDRFLFNILASYPSAEEEIRIIRHVTSSPVEEIHTLLDGDMLASYQALVRRMPAADHVLAFAAQLTRATRPKEREAPDFVKEMVTWGAGPRAGISLVAAAKAKAALEGRTHATTRDVALVAKPVLRHRLLTTFNAEAAGVHPDDIIDRLLKHLESQLDLGI